MKHNKLVLKITSLLLLVALCLSPLFLAGCGWTSQRSVKVEPVFGGRNAYRFNDINNEAVTVETFYMSADEAYVNNPNAGQAVMIKNAIRYKEAYPDKEVYISITSFHYSVSFAVCLDENSKNYLKVKSLYDADKDDEGYVRLSYLLVEAAKKGVNVIAIGQIDASPVVDENSQTVQDLSFEEYYNNKLNEDTEIPNKKVQDFLTFRAAKWTSYGDKSAVDMMHLKSCTVSNYRDANGEDHGPALWLGSINIDAITYQGYNGNKNNQTATVITEHQKLRDCVWNYTKLMADYCGQEEVNEFRHIVNTRNERQIDLILAGRESEIPAEEQIVYLGSDKDKVF